MNKNTPMPVPSIGRERVPAGAPRRAPSPVSILMTWIAAILVAGPFRAANLASAAPVPSAAAP